MFCRSQKERVYASFLSRDLQNNFESWKIFYFGLGVMKCCVFSLEWHTAFYLLVEVFIDAAVYDGNNNIGFAQYIFFHIFFFSLQKMAALQADLWHRETKICTSYVRFPKNPYIVLVISIHCYAWFNDNICFSKNP